MAATTPVLCANDERVLLFGLLLETNARLSKELSAALEQRCGIALAWFEVLLRLTQSDEHQLKMSDVADAIVHSTGGTTRLIDRLEEAGFVKREHCPNDRRAIYVVLTPAGCAKFSEAMAVHEHFLDELISARLSCAEREQLTALLGKLR